MIRRTGYRSSQESGSSIPLILLCFMLAFGLVAGVIATSAAFLEQRRLRSDCDGAALAASSSFDVKALTRGERRGLTLHRELAQQAVRDYTAALGEDSGNTVMKISVQSSELVVHCRRVTHVPFGTLFGWRDGVEYSVDSSVRSPVDDSYVSS